MNMLLAKMFLTKELLESMIEIGEVLVERTDNEFDDTSLAIIKAVMEIFDKRASEEECTKEEKETS